MATLSDADFTAIRRWVKTQPAIRDEFAAWALAKPTWKAVLQAVEDYMVGAFLARPATNIKAAVEAVTGATTNLRARYVLEAWVSWKIKSIQGG